MDQAPRSQKNKSLESAPKSARQNRYFLKTALISLAVAGFYLLSCQSKNASVIPKNMQVPIKSGAGNSLEVTSLGIQITKAGENSAPQFSPDGKKLTYSAKMRVAHAHSQIYVFDLESLNERRVTFQDGECGTPVFTANSQGILYSSTTDEGKERPTVLEKEKSDFLGTEIYQSDIQGARIERLTQRVGFDGNLLRRNDRPTSFIYAQDKKGFLTTWQLNPETKQTIPLFSKEKASVLSLQMSPKGQKWAWIEKDPSTAKTTLMTGKPNFTKASIQPIDIKDTLILDFVWIDDTKILYSGRSDSSSSRIYFYDLEKKCQRALVTHRSNLSQVQINNDQHAITFVSDANGSPQIYLKSIDTNQFTCEETK